MLTNIIHDLYHLENNVFCNDDVIVCRFHKLIIVYLKTQNIFSYYVLKRTKHCNVSSVMMSLLIAEEPGPLLKKLVDDGPPDPLCCTVEEYEVQLVPQSIGNFTLIITHETQQSLAVEKALDSKACIVYLNDFANINPVELFRQISSNDSPNEFIKTNLRSILVFFKNAISSRTYLLISKSSLCKNLRFIPDDGDEIVIYILHPKIQEKPIYPALNFTVVYLDDDRHLAEKVLPTDKTQQSHCIVKKLNSLEHYF